MIATASSVPVSTSNTILFRIPSSRRLPALAPRVAAELS
jgi:hypothetical protein